MGKVFLVGAGPGNDGLFTIRGMNILKKAQVLVFDRLIPKELLQMVPESCEQIYVGKESSKHAMKQDDINKLLADRASEGKLVVRLKGGDPFLFGRGGEEALYLKERGIEFELVPGISAALAVPLYAGIPVTHRKVASSYAIFTGHEDPTKEDSTIDWEHSLGADTLVFFMGVERLDKIVEKIIAVRKDKEISCALIQNGTLPTQKVVVGNLSNIVELAEENSIKPPALFVVGNVVKLRDDLTWFEKKLLFGKRVVVTRSRIKASLLSERLKEEGAEVFEIPVIKCVQIADQSEFDFIFNNLCSYDFIIFSSSTGVDIFFENLFRSGYDSRCIRSKIAVIGDGTSEALLKYGIRADIVPDKFVAESLVDSIEKTNEPKKILIPRAKEGRDELVRGLLEKGYVVDDFHIYSVQPEKILKDEVEKVFQDEKETFITFASSKTAEYFYESLGEHKDIALRKAKVVSIGPITSEKAKNLGFNVVAQAEEYNINGLVKALIDYVKK
ncbi:uroporphyrin-III C-methyltransferase [Thermodesulfobium narugense DSM 14796]|uniref:uroporphyrinogen-III C-methyltransferase n=1 Tax=Thermodesulfobium narugense DSM 14796 TaxID=747365 RepID=M1E5G9_9BACT|nr:uroporphyrinogen-III C-methyltransferase [Thermodesulfobium narugense]AEE15087.1 uroporphyrin-III C-methyltransferase [Thermodesulfobium narugense DSM 14796]